MTNLNPLQNLRWEIFAQSCKFLLKCLVSTHKKLPQFKYAASLQEVELVKMSNPQLAFLNARAHSVCLSLPVRLSLTLAASAWRLC